MYFGTLRYSYDDNTGKQVSKLENKQRITLSEHAVSTLLIDLDALNSSDREYLTVKDIPSADVNKIFRSFCRDADSSVFLRLSVEADSLADTLNGICPQEMLDKIVDTLLEKRREELQSAAQERISRRGTEYYFRINQENQNYLATEQAQKEADVYCDNIGLYFKAVLEEYCDLPYIKREQYYYQDQIRCIRTARDEHKLLKVKLRSVNHTTKKHNVKYVKPYNVYQGSNGLYNYIVGMMSNSPSGPWVVGSIRLSNIISMDEQGRNVTLTQNKKEAMEEAIRTKGTEFISSDEDPQKIVVQFTPNGEKMFKSMLHLRPQYRKKTDERVYEFECTTYHARNYFFKFGKDVTILEPSSLKSQFVEGYRKALRNYEK